MSKAKHLLFGRKNRRQSLTAIEIIKRDIIVNSENLFRSSVSVLQCHQLSPLEQKFGIEIWQSATIFQHFLGSTRIKKYI